MWTKYLPDWLQLRGNKQRNATEPWPLSQPLFKLAKKDDFRIRNAVEGVLIFGTTGGGKSSGSGRTLNRAYLTAGFGGLVLCAKADEARLWLRYALEAGRADDVILFNPESSWRFNFLNEELQRKTRGGGDSEVIANMLLTIAEIIKGDEGKGGGQTDGGFWESSSKLLLQKAIELVAMARGKITISDIYDVLNSAPKSVEQSNSPEWQKASTTYQYLKHIYHRPKSDDQAKDFQILENYWMGTFPETSDKTRSIFVACIMPLIDTLNRNPLRRLFCGETNFTLQALEEGKILIVDLPITEFAEIGKYAAAILKFCAQRSLERRDAIASPRPVFIWQDECQHFVLKTDMMFQTICRSYRVCNVLMTQNISNLYAVTGGGDKSRALVDSLAGTLNTKIFHSNSDSVTNTWMSDHLGKSLQMVCNANISHPSGDLVASALGFGQSNITSGVSEIEMYEVQPSAATALKNGGPANNWEVDAILVCNGMCFHATSRPYLFCTFKQK
jgi:type IV secretory pathway TraG/TraD family ATPase VirD4